MTKKYYAYIVYDDEAYVMMFKVKGSLIWNSKERAFIDRNWYVRSFADIACNAAIGQHPLNNRRFSQNCCFKLTHDQFVRYRSEGVKRWEPRNPVLMWD